MRSIVRNWLVPPLILLAAVAGCGGSGSDGEANAVGDRAEGTTAAPSAGRSPGSHSCQRFAVAATSSIFRHTATDWGEDDEHPVDLSDCDTQRNLSATGRRQARAIGEAIERLDIPIGRVLSSPFCRAVDTARLAFGRVVARRGSRISRTLKATRRRRRNNGLRRLLSLGRVGGRTRPDWARLQHPGGRGGDGQRGGGRGHLPPQARKWLRARGHRHPGRMARARGEVRAEVSRQWRSDGARNRHRVRSLARRSTRVEAAVDPARGRLARVHRTRHVRGHRQGRVACLLRRLRHPRGRGLDDDAAHRSGGHHPGRAGLAQADPGTHRLHGVLGSLHRDPQAASRSGHLGARRALVQLWRAGGAPPALRHRQQAPASGSAAYA